MWQEVQLLRQTKSSHPTTRTSPLGRQLEFLWKVFQVHSRATTSSFCPLLLHTGFISLTSLSLGASNFTVMGEELIALRKRKRPLLEFIAIHELAAQSKAVFQCGLLTACIGINYAKNADSGSHLDLLRQDFYGEAWNMHFYKHSGWDWNLSPTASHQGLGCLSYRQFSGILSTETKLRGNHIWFEKAYKAFVEIESVKERHSQ